MSRLPASDKTSVLPRLFSTLPTLLLLTALLVSCSKGVTPKPDPVVPPTDSSSGKPEDPGGDGGNTDPEAVTRTYSFTEVPVLYPETRTGLFSGAIITRTDAKSLMKPTFISVSQDLRGPVTIYTDVPMDDFALDKIQASRTADNKLLSNIQAEFDKGVDQIPAIYSSSPEVFNHRFNYLRSILGVDQDLNNLFDLGFKDTTRLAENKGRVLMRFNVIKANISLQPPIYAPFLSIDSTDHEWKELFDQESPQIVSSLTFGEEAYLVMESDSSAAALKLAVNRLFDAAADAVVSGAAFNELSSQDQRLLEGSRAYGYVLGDEALPHEGKAALQAYARHYLEAMDKHHMGRLIYFRLHDLRKFTSTAYSFDNTEYFQKIRE